MEKKATLVLGASENPSRYSNLAVTRLNKLNNPVYAIGRKKGQIAGVPIETEKIAFPDIDTITIYLHPSLQKEYYDYILSLRPRRIIFNPGAENEELAYLAESHNILPVDACTLVLLSTHQY